MTCDFCQLRRIDEVEVEAGNNADSLVTIQLCKIHLAEYQKDSVAFEVKYGQRIERCLSDLWADIVDRLKDYKEDK